MKRLFASAALVAAFVFSCAGVASAQEPYLGEVRLFGYNWCPTGWAQANGQLLSISANTALFSLYGTNFGGNGQTTFGLPNLIGRAPYGYGSTAPGQPFAALYGNASVTLTVGQLPAHNHALLATSASPTTNLPSGGLFATFPSNEKIYAPSGSPANAPLSQTSIGMTGNNQPVPTQSPALALNWCVATVGIYPSRP